MRDLVTENNMEGGRELLSPDSNLWPLHVHVTCLYTHMDTEAHTCTGVLVSKEEPAGDSVVGREHWMAQRALLHVLLLGDFSLLAFCVLILCP